MVSKQFNIMIYVFTRKFSYISAMYIGKYNFGNPENPFSIT